MDMFVHRASWARVKSRMRLSYFTQWGYSVVEGEWYVVDGWRYLNWAGYGLKWVRAMGLNGVATTCRRMMKMVLGVAWQ